MRLVEPMERQRHQQQERHQEEQGGLKPSRQVAGSSRAFDNLEFDVCVTAHVGASLHHAHTGREGR
jgi:hypothetical protein